MVNVQFNANKDQGVGQTPSKWTDMLDEDEEQQDDNTDTQAFQEKVVQN